MCDLNQKNMTARKKGEASNRRQASPFLLFVNLSPAQLSSLMNLSSTRSERFSVQLVDLRRKVIQNGV